MKNVSGGRGDRYLALANVEGQHSLWPASVGVPAGWDSIFGPDSRQACLDHIGRRWLDSGHDRAPAIL